MNATTRLFARGNAGRSLAASDAIQLLEDAVLLADLKTGRRVLGEWAAQRGYEALVSDLLEPALASVGERLMRQEVSLAQSYVLCMVVKEVLEHILESHSGDAELAARKGPVVVANIEDDCQPLGRRIVSTFLRVHHWDVCDLGIDVEAEAIVERAIALGARVVGVSAMTRSSAENILKVRAEIDARGYTSRIQLAVGGAVFRLDPDLVRHVKADGTAPNVFAALPLFDELWQRAERGTTDPEHRTGP
ncbi:MAG: cobalamin-dependent protein [Polyangiaceae bacterium]|nr:cobalamin-dependent protein [Polyangiaceae bacterium]